MMPDQPPHELLSTREKDILTLLCDRLSDREIAERLYLAVPTVKWFNRQIFNKLGVDGRKQAVGRAAELRLLDTQDGAQDKPPAPHNLPAQLTPFIGRSVELTEIGKLLMQPVTRLVTVLAPGGMGKTRLALEAAESLLDRFADGVYFVALAPLTSAEQIMPAVAEALGLQFAPDGRTPQKQLEDFLRRKTLLLVLDNFEHLLDAAPIVAELLSAAPKVKALVTSRERLNLQGETMYVLGGLQYPEADAGDPLRYGAAQLFVESALRTDPHFEAGDGEAIGRLCRRVQGMPLAIELAAAWTGMLSVAEIDAEVAQTADFLETSMSNVPERQRSVRAMFDAAWARLDERSRQAFRRMSVFRGGCTREAAQAVTGMDARTLMGLVDKALLWRDPRSGRFDIHELLRQYAEGELESAAEREAALQAHQDYYAAKAAEWGAATIGDGFMEAIGRLDEDIANVLQAMRRAAGRGIADEIEAFTDLWMYAMVRIREREIDEAFEIAGAALEPEDSVALSKLLSARANYCMRGYLDLGYACAKRALEIATRLNAREAMPFALIMHGWFHERMHNDSATAAAMYRQAIQISREVSRPMWTAPAHFHLGNQAFNEGRKADAQSHFSVTSDVSATLNNLWGLSISLGAQAEIALAMGDLDAARRYCSEQQRAARMIGYREEEARAILGLGLVAREERDWQAAWSLAEESTRLLENHGAREPVILGSRIAAAEAALHLGETATARDALLDVHSIARALHESSQFRRWVWVAMQYFNSVGDFACAAALYGVVDTNEPDRHAFSPVEKLLFDEVRDGCLSALGAAAFEAARNRGEALTMEEAMTLAVEAL